MIIINGEMFSDNDFQRIKEKLESLNKNFFEEELKNFLSNIQHGEHDFHGISITKKNEEIIFSLTKKTKKKENIKEENLVFSLDRKPKRNDNTNKKEQTITKNMKQ